MTASEGQTTSNEGTAKRAQCYEESKSDSMGTGTSTNEHPGMSPNREARHRLVYSKQSAQSMPEDDEIAMKVPYEQQPKSMQA